MDTTETFFQNKKIRPTAMRQLIYKYMAKKDVAVALTDIENAFAKAERTTLYRTIKTFEERGVVHQIDDGTGIAKYALCDGCDVQDHNDLHLHFHCNNCDETSCLTEYKIPQISLPKGFIAEDVNLTVKGLCDKCSIN